MNGMTENPGQAATLEALVPEALTRISEDSVSHPRFDGRIASGTDWPSITAVIPTLNCSKKLERCLRSLVNQDYPGALSLLVVDGGSHDSTIEVALKFGAKVHVNPGQYVGGANGSRADGERMSYTDLIWYVDSDNYMIGNRVATLLAQPFLKEPRLSLSVPLPYVDPKTSQLSQWLALEDRASLLSEAYRGTRQENCFIVDSLKYGLTNSVLIKRQHLLDVGGYDVDVRVLRRLRARLHARAAIVPAATFVHQQEGGLMYYRSKWIERIVRYGHMSHAERLAFLSSSKPTDYYDSVGPVGEAIKQLVRPITTGIKQFMDCGNPTWLVGLAYPIVPISIFFRHPLLTLDSVRWMT